MKNFQDNWNVSYMKGDNAQYAQFLYGLEAYLGNDLAAALPRFRKARELNPADPRTALYLGLTVESLGKPEEALALYEDAVRLAGLNRADHGSGAVSCLGPPGVGAN